MMRLFIVHLLVIFLISSCWVSEGSFDNPRFSESVTNSASLKEVVHIDSVFNQEQVSLLKNIQLGSSLFKIVRNNGMDSVFIICSDTIKDSNYSYCYLKVGRIYFKSFIHIDLVSTDFETINNNHNDCHFVLEKYRPTQYGIEYSQNDPDWHGPKCLYYFISNPKDIPKRVRLKYKILQPFPCR